MPISLTHSETYCDLNFYAMPIALITKPHIGRRHMDQSRRNTLKFIGATGIATTVGTITPLTSATAAKAPEIESPLAADQFSVQLEHSWGGQDASVVIKNTSNNRTAITNISPSFVSAEPGLFDFSAVTKKGARSIEPGEEIRIPFTPMGSPISAIGHFDRSLQKRLRDTLEITTEKQRLATTSTSLNPRIV